MYVVIENWEETTDDYRSVVAGRYATEQEARRAAWRMAEEVAKHDLEQVRLDPTYCTGQNEFDVMLEADWDRCQDWEASVAHRPSD